MSHSDDGSRFSSLSTRGHERVLARMHTTRAVMCRLRAWMKRVPKRNMDKCTHAQVTRSRWIRHLQSFRSFFPPIKWLIVLSDREGGGGGKRAYFHLCESARVSNSITSQSCNCIDEETEKKGKIEEWIIYGGHREPPWSTHVHPHIKSCSTFLSGQSSPSAVWKVNNQKCSQFRNPYSTTKEASVS